MPLLFILRPTLSLILGFCQWPKHKFRWSLIFEVILWKAMFCRSDIVFDNIEYALQFLIQYKTVSRLQLENPVWFILHFRLQVQVRVSLKVNPASWQFHIANCKLKCYIVVTVCMVRFSQWETGLKFALSLYSSIIYHKSGLQLHSLTLKLMFKS